jgi:integrase
LPQVYPEVQRIPKKDAAGRPVAALGPDGVPKPVYISRKTGFWTVEYRDAAGNRRRERGGASKAEAEAFLCKRLAELDRGAAPAPAPAQVPCSPAITPIAFSDFAAKYLDYVRPHKRSWQRDAAILRMHLVPAFGPKLLHAITVREIEDYRAKRLKAVRIVKEGKPVTIKPSTINRETAILKHMYYLARRWKYAVENPVCEVDFFPEPNEIVRYLLPDALEALYAACADHLRPIVKWAANSGMRKSEVLNLKRSDVLREQGVVLVRQTKSGRPREVPLNDVLLEILDSLPAGEADGYVFATPQGKRWIDVGDSFDKAKRIAGVDPAFRFHDLRHTFASNAVMAGIDLVTLKEILGHSSLKMVLRYAHLSPGHKREAMRLIGERMKGGRKPPPDGGPAEAAAPERRGWTVKPSRARALRALRVAGAPRLQGDQPRDRLARRAAAEQR